MSMQLDSRRPMATNRLLSRMTRDGSTSSTRTLAKLRASTKCLMISRKRALVVEVRLQVGRIDGDETLGQPRGLVHRLARFGERA